MKIVTIATVPTLNERSFTTAGLISWLKNLNPEDASLPLVMEVDGKYGTVKSFKVLRKEGFVVLGENLLD